MQIHTHWNVASNILCFIKYNVRVIDYNLFTFSQFSFSLSLVPDSSVPYSAFLLLLFVVVAILLHFQPSPGIQTMLFFSPVYKTEIHSVYRTCYVHKYIQCIVQQFEMSSRPKRWYCCFPSCFFFIWRKFI